MLIAVISAATLAAAVAPAPANNVPENGLREDTKITLTEIREGRLLEVQGTGEQRFMFAQDRPGLRLSLDLALPEGVRLLEVEQPAEVGATDSTGRDLSDIEPGFMDEREYIEVQQSMGFDDEETKSSLTFHLAVTAREAKTFSLTAAAKATVFTGTKTITHPLTSAWADLDPNLFAGEKVRVRIGEAFGEPGVEFAPASASRYIDDLSVESAGETLESAGYASDSRTITYWIDGLIDPQASPRVNIIIRTGLRDVPLQFNFKDQKLP